MAFRDVVFVVLIAALSACVTMSNTGDTLADTKRVEDKKIFKAAMADLDDLRELSALGCGHGQIGDVRLAIDHFIQREAKLAAVDNPKDLDRVRRYQWTLQFGLADEAVERHCNRLFEELHAALVQSYRTAILGNPEAKASPDMETMREAMGL
ncbi:MAG: hypothetical protein EXQ94_07875 [Alphaproteobacteria bacterium]|nr:hypothetical protein [Alphaproteobacteria bacterium]